MSVKTIELAQKRKKPGPETESNTTHQLLATEKGTILLTTIYIYIVFILLLRNSRDVIKNQ
jgi:hypothetical protein